ncbi:MAG: flagellar filament capping protein FliD [Nitrospinae bacterium]|nr:flagellar filament capping protein FliD [Nitrospinota bacterium]
MVTINTNSNATSPFGTNTTSSTSFNPAITLSGLGSSFDTGAMVNSLIQVERIPIFSIQAKQAKLSSKETSVLQMKDLLKTVQTTAEKFRTEIGFNSKAASFTNSDTSATTKVADVTASSSAVPGDYDLSVTQLATSSRYIFDQGFSSQFSSLGILPDAENPYITIDSGSSSATIFLDTNETLISLRNKINSSSFTGNASIINDGSSSPNKLVIQSTVTGADNDFTLIIPQFLEGAQRTVPVPLSATKLQTAQDAIFTVDGTSFTKTTNEVTDALAGITLNLNTTGSGTIKVVADDTNTKSTIEQFVTDYNQLASFIKQQSTFVQGQDRPVLFGDSSLRSVEMAMKSIINNKVTGSVYNYDSLASIGIKSNNSGQLLINDTTLTNALKTDPDAVQNIFIANGTSSDSSKANYVTHTNDTVGVTYDIKEENGTIYVKTSGTNTWDEMTSPLTNYYRGKTGKNEDGLLIYVPSGQTGFNETVTVNRGIFDALNAKIADLLDSTSGSVGLREKGISKQINDYNDDIKNIEQRVQIKAENIKQKFVQLESFMAQSESQKQYLTGQLASMTGTSKK